MTELYVNNDLNSAATIQWLGPLSDRLRGNGETPAETKQTVSGH